MDVVQKRLRILLHKIDIAFEQFKQCPDSEEHATYYEHAKEELNDYLAEVKISLTNRTKHRQLAK